MARSGARVPRRLGVAHVGKDDLKVVLILLDSFFFCTNTPRLLGGVHVSQMM